MSITDFVMDLLKEQLMEPNPHNQFKSAYFERLNDGMIMARGIMEYDSMISIYYKDDYNNVKSPFYSYMDKCWKDSPHPAFMEIMKRACQKRDMVYPKTKNIAVATFSQPKIVQYLVQMEKMRGNLKNGRLVFVRPVIKEEFDNGDGRIFGQIVLSDLDKMFYREDNRWFIDIFDGNENYKFLLNEDDSFFVPGTTNEMISLKPGLDYLCEFIIDQGNRVNILKVQDPYYKLSIGYNHSVKEFGNNPINNKFKVNINDSSIVMGERYKDQSKVNIEEYVAHLNRLRPISPREISGTNKVMAIVNGNINENVVADFPPVHIYSDIMFITVNTLSKVDIKTFDMYLNANPDFPVMIIGENNNHDVYAIEIMLNTLDYRTPKKGCRR